MEEFVSNFGFFSADSNSGEAPVLEVNCNKDHGDTETTHVPYWMRALTPDMSYLLSDKKGYSRTSILSEYSLLRESDSSSDEEEDLWTERSPIMKEGGGDSEVVEVHIVNDDEEIHTETIQKVKDDNLVNIPPVWRFIQGLLIVLIIGLVSFLLIRFVKRPWENSAPVTHHDIHVT
ncbi:uncharacterized protein LOC132557863 [Ylistrum balloti]|uniref:uncharacterized protein LOC132557863 n=1 Tax=Ylistrum balloti TaxID=509963 RepID=UPI002905ED10|nr:uncharacterized protein LOC132557863 [Ylistrum balloti]